MRNNFFLLLILSAIFFNSCKKNVSQEGLTLNENVRFPKTAAEKKKVEIAKEVSEVLREVYKNHQAFYEVNAAIYSGYYEDERVLLKDVLFPEESKLYQQESFKKFNAKVGGFKAKFYKVLAEGEYPEVKAILHYNDLTTANLPTSSPVDTAAEIFSNLSGVSIYFPYSENFVVPLTQTYFSNVNTDTWGFLATVIPADREADTAPGLRPYRTQRSENGEEPGLEYTPVTVSDAFSEVFVTHIVGFGVVPRITADPPPPATNVNRVYIGWTRINDRQYDKFISFNSANGGGSEVKLCRISGYLSVQNQQVTTFTGDIGEVHFTRKQINRGIWKRVYWVWDADWVVGNTEQIMAVYEEDSEGTNTFTGTVGTTVLLNPGTPPTTATGSASYSVSVKTQDDLVLQRKITRAAYFGAAKTDQGWGFYLCDKSGGACRYDNTFLTTGNYWPAYDGNGGGGSSWNYTWPYQSY